MNRLTNRVSLIGNLGADPKMQTLKSGAKADISLATNESYTNANGEKTQDTQWHNLVAWGKTAEIAGKYLRKGSKIAVEGRLQHRSYEDDGIKRYVTEVKINDFLMLDGANKSE